MIGDSNDETNFLHKLLLTNIQISRFRKAFANGSSPNIKFSKSQLSKMVQLTGFLPFIQPMLKAVMQIPVIFDKFVKDKCIPETILNVGDNLLNIKTNINPLLFLKVSRITVTSNEIKDIMNVPRE